MKTPTLAASAEEVSASAGERPGRAVVDTAGQPVQLRISGDWTLQHYRVLKRQTDDLGGNYDANVPVDLSGLHALDTAGASLLVELLGTERLARLAVQAPDLPVSSRALLQTIQSALCDYCAPVKEPEVAVGLQLLSRIGGAVYTLWMTPCNCWASLA